VPGTARTAVRVENIRAGLEYAAGGVTGFGYIRVGDLALFVAGFKLLLSKSLPFISSALG
jgi:hypothetical protein